MAAHTVYEGETVMDVFYLLTGVGMRGEFRDDHVPKVKESHCLDHCTRYLSSFGFCKMLRAD